MIRAGIIGLGKMGVSHCAIVNSHPKASVVAVCDTSGPTLQAFKKYSSIMTYSDYKEMLLKESLDCVFVASPTRFHVDMVEASLSAGCHTFCEKPFVLNVSDGDHLADLAQSKKLVTQVGYHNRFLATFRKVKELLAEGIIGDVYHFHAESHGPVVTQPKTKTWRSKSEEGGGCLYDYASHVINLVDFLLGAPESVRGTCLNRVFSREVEDAVFSVLHLKTGVSGILAVNWSDDSYRKMTTQIAIQGTKGKIISDAQELKVFLKESSASFKKGWNMRYITDFPEEINFYLRGEEYTLQVDHFINRCIDGKMESVNSFQAALSTDKTIKMLKADAVIYG